MMLPLCACGLVDKHKTALIEFNWPT